MNYVPVWIPLIYIYSNSHRILQKSTREYTNIKYSTEAIGGGEPLRPIMPMTCNTAMGAPLNINSNTCSATLPARRSSARSDGIPR